MQELENGGAVGKQSHHPTYQSLPTRLTVRRLLRDLEVGYRLYVKRLPSRPDIVMKERKKIIEVRGCYWHRHPEAGSRTPPRAVRSSGIRSSRPMSAVIGITKRLYVTVDGTYSRSGSAKPLTLMCYVRGSQSS
ncbi:hypothetical protein [Microvirga yunnanensis]|uniref:hypothetical protein n=1 Tax=Microvirga yunnanensis TaxID=2953740 RepID=UPI0035A0E484